MADEDYEETDEDSVETAVTGDPNKCRKCGRMFSEHAGVFRSCPGREFQSFESAFESDGQLKTEFTNNPVCPYCGDEVEDWNEYPSCTNASGGRFDCPKCGKKYDVEVQVEYSFTTRRPDFEAEDKYKAKLAKRRQEAHEKAEKFLPGEKIRVTDKTTTIFKGWCGVVANKELSKDCGFVSVELDVPEPREGKNRKYVTFLTPEELEKI